MKLKTGAIVTDLSGSLGGQYASRSGSGISLRQKGKTSKPVPRSENISFFSSSNLLRTWRTLNPVQQQLWTRYAMIFSQRFTSVSGYTSTGLNAYLICNTNRQSVGLSILSSPVYDIEIEVPSVDKFYVRPSIFGIILYLTSVFPSQLAYNISMTRFQSVGKLSQRKAFISIKASTNSGFSQLNLGANYIATIGAYPPVNTRIFAQTNFFYKDSGLPAEKRVYSQVAS